MADKRGTHDYVEDLRNAEVLVYINGKFYPRQDASISVFDTGFLLGDHSFQKRSPLIIFSPMEKIAFRTL